MTKIEAILEMRKWLKNRKRKDKTYLLMKTAYNKLLYGSENKHNES